MQEASLTEEVTAQRATLSQALEARKKAETELVELQEESTSQISHLMDSLEQKSKAGEERGGDIFTGQYSDDPVAFPYVWVLWL